MRWAGHVAHMRKTGELHTRFWWEKPDGKGPLGRARHRWVTNIKIDL